MWAIFAVVSLLLEKCRVVLASAPFAVQFLGPIVVKTWLAQMIEGLADEALLGCA